MPNEWRTKRFPEYSDMYHWIQSHAWAMKEWEHKFTFAYGYELRYLPLYPNGHKYLEEGEM